ncbi:hypothetical protein OFC10_33900, partial [Escherichia coli]|nr:hypothetical protein [Escherichia coli]
VFDLPGHNYLFYTQVFEETDHFSELADPDPADRVGHMFYCGIRFFADSNDGKVFALPFGAFDYKEWKFAVAGYQAIFHRKR